MDAFATVSDYEARFGPVADAAMLEECLKSATVAIIRAVGTRLDYDNPDDTLEYALMDVCRSVANRIMPSGTDIPVGATQMSTTAGPYQQTFSLPTAYSSPKLLPSELAMLGLGARVGWAPLGGHDD